MLWAVLSIVAGFGDATIFAITKKLKGVNKAIIIWMQVLIAVPFLLALLYFFQPDNVDSSTYAIGALLGILLLGNHYLLVSAAQIGSLSLSMPLLSTTPLFLLFTSYVMLGEFPTTLGVAGVFFIVTGAYVINIRKERKGLLAPFSLLISNKGSQLALLAAFVMSIMANLFKMGILSSSPIFFSTILHVYMAVLMTILVLMKYKEKMSQIKENAKLFTLLGLSTALMSAAAAFANLLAIVPYVVSLKRSSAFFSILYGKFLFGEDHLVHAIIGTAIMIVGGILIVLF